jgi:hypothetical protein
VCLNYLLTMSSYGDQVPTIYKEDIRRYEELTKKKLDGLLSSIVTVDDLLKRVDSENKTI